MTERAPGDDAARPGSSTLSRPGRPVQAEEAGGWPARSAARAVGAKEIDAVLPCRALLHGREGPALQVLGGQFETLGETQREMRIVIVLAVFLVLVVMVVQYEQLTNPLVIMTAAPLALVGGLLALWLSSTPLSAPVFLGGVLLIGIVVNNAILLVEYVEQRRHAGDTLEHAVAEAGAVRLRPILMTTLTTVVGMLPLAIGMDAGGRLMQPLAVAVVGGLLSSMLLTLVLIPCLYAIAQPAAERLLEFLTRRRRRAVVESG